MRYMLYCILETPKNEDPQLPLGVGDEPVFLVGNGGLSAAVSRIALSDLTPDIARVLAYEEVIESLHRARTVIPMRYGCVFEEESEVVRLLGRRREEYEALLGKLDGCVEMGIRVLPGDEEYRVSNGERRGTALASHAEVLERPGRAYLDARRADYARQEQVAEEAAAILGRCRAAFTGLFVQCGTEAPSFGTIPGAFRVQLPSLHFLLRKPHVERFRDRFRRFCSREPAKFLLSGPWPPYNFAESAEDKSQGETLEVAFP